MTKKLSNSENSIQGYRDEKNIINISQETETDLRKISQLKIQQTNVKMNLEAIHELDEYIKNGKENFLDLAPNFEAFTDLLSTEMVKKIKQLQGEKKDLLLTYALGRGLGYSDKPAVHEIVRRTKAAGYKFQDMILAVCESVPFQKMRAGAE